MYFLPLDANARLCGADRGAGAFGGEGLVEYGVGLAAVDDVDAGDALLDGLDAAVDLGDHAAGDGALVFERLDVLNVEVADDIAHLDVVAQALDVGEDDELFRTERAGELARGGVAVDVVGVALPVGADGGDDGDEARVEHGVDGVGVDVVDVADEAELSGDTLKVQLRHSRNDDPEGHWSNLYSSFNISAYRSRPYTTLQLYVNQVNFNYKYYYFKLN